MVMLSVEVCKRSWLEIVSNVTQGVLLACHGGLHLCNLQRAQQSSHSHPKHSRW